MNLSQNFTLAQLTFSQTAARLGIDNTPGPEIIEHLTAVAVGLERVQQLLGHPILISSGYRSPALNASIPGSAKTSAHMEGWAADFTCEKFGDPMAVCKAISESELMFDQLILEYGRWAHISFKPPMRRRTLTIYNAQQGYLLGLVEPTPK